MSPLAPTDGRYLVDRVVAATRAGRGWQLTVKWVGYDETTVEPLWRILQDTKGHPEILQEIEKCKADYYLQHPGARNADLADFQDVSLVHVESLRSPLETLPISSFIRNREQAVHFLDLNLYVDAAFDSIAC